MGGRGGRKWSRVGGERGGEGRRDVGWGGEGEGEVWGGGGWREGINITLTVIRQAGHKM